MKSRLLILPIVCGLSLASLLAAQRHTPPRAKVEKPMHVYSLGVANQWGADLAPDGSAVAVAKLRRVAPEETKKEEVFVEVEVWDFVAQKLLAQRTLSHRPASASLTAEWGEVRYSGDGKVLLVYDGEILHVLRSATLDEITRIDLGLPSWPRDSQVVDLVTPRDVSGELAILLSWGGGRGGALRIYDLQTGTLRRQWEFDRGYPELGAHAVWRPDGRRVAVSLLPLVPGEEVPKEQPNVQVMDAESGKVLARFNAGYAAGPLCFTPKDTLITATASPAWALVFGRHKIKIWNATTGRLLREIDSPPAGVRSSLAISADGKLLFGYTGAERANTAPNASDSTLITEQRFRVWEVASGRVVATSPKILPLGVKRPELRLSAKGDRVLVFWQDKNMPLVIYEVQ